MNYQKHSSELIRITEVIKAEFRIEYCLAEHADLVWGAQFNA